MFLFIFREAVRGEVFVQKHDAVYALVVEQAVVARDDVVS